MSYLLFIVLAFLLYSQGKRISDLEKIIKGKVVTHPSNEITSTHGAAVSPASPPEHISPMLQPEPRTMPEAEASVAVNMPHEEESSGRLLAGIGIAAVLLGVAFFLRYAFVNNWIGPMGKVMIGVFFGIFFLGLGQFLRKKYLNFSDILMGGGVAILYLSIYSAHSFYNLIDPFTTGLLMFMVTILTFAISIVNATISLALVAVIGGFATPNLVGADANNMLPLFGYLTLLNVCVLGISFFKKWPELVLAAFMGTVINFLGWHGVYYTEDVLGPTLLFLVASFVIFLISSIARVVVTSAKANAGDYFLIGADAFCIAVMGYILLRPNYHEVLGFASVFIAVIYMVVAYLANKYNSSDKALNIFLPGLAVVFLSMAVPLQFSGSWIAVGWLVEAFFLYAISSFISNRGFQVMGAVVYVLGLINYCWWGVYGSNIKFVPIFNSQFAVLTLAVIVAYSISYMYKRFGSVSLEIQKRGVMAFVVVANILTVYAVTTQINGYYESLVQNAQAEQSVALEQTIKYSDNNYEIRSEFAAKNYDQFASIRNQSNTAVSIFWAMYAAILIALGFIKRNAGLRRLGLILFIVTAVKVVSDVWALGDIYRVISFIGFGVIALSASFAYAKYKDRLKEIL